MGKDNQLSLVEKNDLQYNEGIIQKGLESWRQVSEALLTIRDGRLYRESHKSFEAYCRDRWNISRPRAYQLIGSSEVVKELPEKMSNMLDNPRQAAELAKVPTEKREKVIERTIEREGKLTAKAIKETARETAPVEVVEEEETPLPPGHSSWAMSYVDIAIEQLDMIPDQDPDFDKAFEMLQEYFKSRGLIELETCTPKPADNVEELEKCWSACSENEQYEFFVRHANHRRKIMDAELVLEIRDCWRLLCEDRRAIAVVAIGEIEKKPVTTTKA